MKRLILNAITIVLLLSLVSCTSNFKEISTTQDTAVPNDIPKTTQLVLDTPAKQSNQASDTKIKENTDASKTVVITPSLDQILENPQIIPGRFVVNRNWIYYIKLLDAESGKTAIYKMDIATSKSIEVCKDSPYNIYTDGEWIYYDKLADGESESDEVYTEQIGVYKIKPDGTSRCQIIKGVRLEDVRDGWIYYSKVEMTNGEEGDNCLFSMKIDSSNSKLVLKDFQVIQLVDKYIYYLNNYAIGRINLDGSNPKIICYEDQLFKDTYFQRFLVKDNVMYFSTTNSSESIYKNEGLFRVNLDGTGMKNILYANIHDSDFVVYKDRIFYVSVEPPKENTDKISNLFTYTVNEFNTKNNKGKPLFQVYDGALNLVGDWLYYSKTYEKSERLNLSLSLTKNIK